MLLYEDGLQISLLKEVRRTEKTKRPEGMKKADLEGGGRINNKQEREERG